MLGNEGIAGIGGTGKAVLVIDGTCKLPGKPVFGMEGRPDIRCGIMVFDTEAMGEIGGARTGFDMGGTGTEDMPGMTLGGELMVGGD